MYTISCRVFVSVKALTTSVGTVDQYLLSGVKEAHEQLSLILDIIVELYQTQSIPEDALTDTYHLACIHSEVNHVLL